VIEDIQSSGTTSLGAIADELNARGRLIGAPWSLRARGCFLA
jgi:hypothetical protein